MKKITRQIALLLLLVTGNTPLYAQLLMKGGYSHEFTTHPGGIYQKSISLTNQGKTPQEVKIYLEDYMFSAGAGSRFTPARLNKNPRSNSRWIQVRPNRLLLAPGASKTVSYTMTVPKGNLTGTYWSALIIEPVAPVSLESSQQKNNGKAVQITIQQISRHAVQIVAQMGNSGNVKLQLKHPVLKKEKAKRSFSLDAYNSGNRWIKPTVWLDVYNQQGTFIGKFEGEGARVYPNTSATLGVDISRLKSGKYKGLFVVDGGNNADILATDVNLTIK